MKKVCLFLFISSLLFINNNAYSITPSADKAASVKVDVKNSNLTEKEDDVIKKFSLKNKFQRSAESQIQSFFKKYNRYSEKNDIEALKNLYSDSFVNNDGFNKKTIFELMELAVDAYKNVKYTTTIEKMKIDGDYAVVYAHEYAEATTTAKQVQVNDYGQVISDIYYKDYLQKEADEWKLISTTIESEKLYLKYGEAKKMDISVTAPEVVPANVDYNVKIKTTSPDGVFLLGSIVNEQIVHPQTEKKEVYKSIKSGELQRILKANADNHNEYATITIGVTRPIVNPPDITFNMTGMAFIMARVNVVNDNNNKKSKEIVNGKK